MSAKQVFYRFFDSKGRRIDIRGFSLRENLVISDTPPITNAVHKQQPLPIIPSIRPGNPIDQTEFIKFAKANAYSLHKQVDGASSDSLNTELEPDDFALAANDTDDSVTLGWTGDAGTYEVQKNLYNGSVGFYTIFKGTKAAGAKTLEDADVKAGDKVYYRLRFIDSDGNTSHFSDSLEVTVTAGD